MILLLRDSPEKKCILDQILLRVEFKTPDRRKESGFSTEGGKEKAPIIEIGAFSSGSLRMEARAIRA